MYTAMPNTGLKIKQQLQGEHKITVHVKNDTQNKRGVLRNLRPRLSMETLSK
jgi:hypothetical protein